ncbi:type VII secretion target [Kitasatospora sp. NBC_01250]|uniref:type VII secretion target n=1 Tax=unclassified Kitasatospora TaxID=2633591 RepID=UPI002E0F1410|nr:MULTISPECIES: type VII secretion target [unclassified Kitasatospora]WSJ66903.1 type VII secretion target [Kitasatospora sp. NBC_01302]
MNAGTDGGGGGQFEVHPASLTSLAGRFDTEAGQFNGQVSSFTSAADTAGQAFGLLGACDGALSQYQSLLGSTTKALGQLHQVLGGNADRLRATASAYAAAEAAAHQKMSSVGQTA